MVLLICTMNPKCCFTPLNILQRAKLLNYAVKVKKSGNDRGNKIITVRMLLIVWYLFSSNPDSSLPVSVSQS